MIRRVASLVAGHWVSRSPPSPPLPSIPFILTTVGLCLTHTKPFPQAATSLRIFDRNSTHTHTLTQGPSWEFGYFLPSQPNIALCPATSLAPASPSNRYGAASGVALPPTPSAGLPRVRLVPALAGGPVCGYPWLQIWLNKLYALTMGLGSVIRDPGSRIRKKPILEPHQLKKYKHVKLRTAVVPTTLTQ
jgi:hypothetical protein